MNINKHTINQGIKKITTAIKKDINTIKKNGKK